MKTRNLQRFGGGRWRIAQTRLVEILQTVDGPHNAVAVAQSLLAIHAGPEAPETLTATGFHRLMQWDDEPADRKQHVYVRSPVLKEWDPTTKNWKLEV